MPTLKIEEVHKQIDVYGKVEDLHPEVKFPRLETVSSRFPLCRPTPQALQFLFRPCTDAPPPAWKQQVGEPGWILHSQSTTESPSPGTIPVSPFHR